MSTLRLSESIPQAPALVSPGMLREPILQDDSRARFDRNNLLLLLEGIQPDALFIGDSLTADWPVETLFADLFPVVVNRALGGDGVKYLHRRLDADVIQLQPKNLFFMVGTNDIAFRFGYDSDDTIFAEMMANYRLCCDMIRRAGIRTYLGTIPPVRRMMLNDVLFHRKLVLLPRLNDALRAMAEEYGFILLDYYAELVDAHGEFIAELTTDGCHFTAQGYYVANRLVRRVLAEFPPA